MGIAFLHISTGLRNEQRLNIERRLRHQTYSFTHKLLTIDEVDIFGYRFEEQEPPGSRSFFTEIIASISDIKFGKDGRYLLSRDYMTLKVCNSGHSYLGNCEFFRVLDATHSLFTSSIQQLYLIYWTAGERSFYKVLTMVLISIKITLDN